MYSWNIRKLSDKELIKICNQFRSGVLGRSKSKNKCFMVSSPLFSYLRFLKIECELTKGYVTIGENITEHFWITLPDCRIIDPTADQFNEIRKAEMPKVYLGEKPNWYMENKITVRKSRLIFVN